jgi:D-xylose transport system substrate-binding protein
MRKRFLPVVAALAALTLGLAACGDDGGNEPSTGGSGGTGKVGVILPDAATSPRWEANDRPLLKAAFDSAGIQSDIQNAGGDKSKFGTICDSMINSGVNVLLIVNLDSDSGSACLKKAQQAGIKTIDYDRLTLGGGASYYVSFDNVGVGKLMGEGLQKCLTDAGKTSGVNIVYINGDPTDNNAALFKQGYVEALKPKVDDGSYKVVGDQTGNWDATKAGTAFEQLYTQNGGKIDGVVSANDTMAQGIIARLTANNLAGKVPVTGQDASKEGLQAILKGNQCMTVYKAIKKEADAASQLAIALIKGESPSSSLVNGTVKDTVANVDVPSALQTPQAIFKDSVKDVIADGFWKASDICTGEYQALCRANGVQEAQGGPGGLFPCASRPARPGLGDKPSEVSMTTAAEAARPSVDENQAPQLSLRGVNKSFGAVHVLQDVDFNAYSGQVTALVGDNGAGKSTLIKGIAGTQPFDSGEYLFEGNPVHVTTPKQANDLGIEVVYQDLALCDNLDIVDNMFLGRELTKGGLLDESTMEQRAMDTLSGLSVRTVKSIHQVVASLSGGQRQTVAIARAVLWNSRLVILDEPTAALGVAQTEQVLNLVRRLADNGLAVVLISHNLNDVFQVADRIAVLYLGKMAGEVSASDVNNSQVVEMITTGKPIASGTSEVTA